MTKRLVIVGGGCKGPWVLEHLQEGDTLVGADRGALFLLQSGIKPDIAIGDFDSVTEDERKHIRNNCGQMVECDPILKDLTDTEMAVRWAIDQSPSSILLIGALGTRFDHSLANVHLLAEGVRNHIPIMIIDENNRIHATSESLTLEKSEYTYVSLLPLSSEVKGITLDGFRYPLQDATLTIGQSLGISNELVNPIGVIRICSGILLVIESRD